MHRKTEKTYTTTYIIINLKLTIMRKFTLLTALFALFAISASAATKKIYSQNYDGATSVPTTWASPNIASGIELKSDNEGKYISITTSGSGQRSARNIWGDVIGEYTNYTLSFDFQFVKLASGYYGTELCVIAANGKIPESTNNNYTTLDGSKYIFDLSQVEDANEYKTFKLNGTGTTISPTEGAWLTLTLTVDGKNVSYQLISKYGGDILAEGKYVLGEDVDSKAVGIWYRAARGQGVTYFDDFNITTEVEGAVANEPTVVLSKVRGNDRVYLVSFDEGEILHYILPGKEVEEEPVASYDAEVEGIPGNGNLEITATQSGTLKVWTVSEMDETVKSEEVTIPVTTGWIKLVDPVVEIAGVSEGYGKSYRVTFDAANATHLLPVQAAIQYSINNGELTEVSNGGTIVMDKAGTLVITVNQIPIVGNEYYERSSVTIQNDVEYELKEEKIYAYTPAELANLSSNFNQKELSNSGRSQWERVYAMPGSDANALEGRNLWGLWNGSDTKVCDVYGIKDESLDAMTAPLYVADTEKSVERNAYTFFPYEGLVYWSTATGNNHDLHIDPKYISDDTAKPNFYIVHVTTQYDRPDKPAQDTEPGKFDGVFQTYVRKTDAVYTQYRFDNAISKVQVFTYKKPQDTAIEAVKTVDPAVSADAPIYNLSGVRVANANQKGIYIQNGKKFVVK